MHKFTEDFYGDQLKIVLLGELRPMTTFNNARKCSGKFFEEL